MSSLENLFFHKFHKGTNLMEPKNDFISPTKFPKQNEELLNTIVTLKYRNETIVDETTKNTMKAEIVDHKTGKLISSRPADDKPYEERKGNSGDENVVFTGHFKILRADMEMPFRYIALSEDYKMFLVGYMNEDGTINKDIIPIYFKDDNSLIGLFGFLRYNLYATEYIYSDKYTAICLSADSKEPCNAIFAELYETNDNIKNTRFILSDEVYFDISVTEGRKIINIKINDEGRFDIQVTKYNFTDSLTDSQIIQLRKFFFENNFVYKFDEEDNNDSSVLKS